MATARARRRKANRSVLLLSLLPGAAVVSMLTTSASGADGQRQLAPAAAVGHSTGLADAHGGSVQSARAAHTAAVRSLRRYRDSANIFQRYDNRSHTLCSATQDCDAQARWGGPAGAGLASLRLTEIRILQRLLASLDSAAVFAPDDAWLTSMRVRYRALHGDFDLAEELINSGCSNGGWWCSALRGWIFHLDRRFTDAAREFDAALATMPEEQRCEWNNVGLLMAGLYERNEYYRMGCEEQARLNEWIWLLADPLYLDEGNDRRTEHFSRWVKVELMELEGREVYGQSMPRSHYGRTLRGALRYTTNWCVIRLGVSCSKFIDGGRSSGPTRNYLPSRAVRLEPFRVGILDNTLVPASLLADTVRPVAQPESIKDRLLPRRSPTRNRIIQFPPPRMAPFDSLAPRPGVERYTFLDNVLHEIRDAQVAFLRRGDSALMLAAFDPRAGRTARGEVEAAVTSTRGPRDVPRQTIIRDSAPGPWRTALPTTFDSAIVSLEGRVPSVWAARHRFAVHPLIGPSADSLRASELVLYDAATGVLPTSLDSVLAVMLPRTRLLANESIGFYWELYGLTPGAQPEFELRASALDGPGIIGALGGLVGLGGRRDSLATRWQGAVVDENRIGPDGETGFSIAVSLGELDPGTYRLTVSSRIAGQSVAAVKIVRVERPIAR